MGIHLSKVGFHYTKNKNKDGIKDISIDIFNGDFLFILGATGSGKTTLVSHLNALLLPQEGFLFVDDYKIKAKRGFYYNLIREKIGLSLQFPEYQLFAETVYKDVMFGPENFKIKKELRKKYVDEALELMSITDLSNRSPLELSGGQMRKLAIAGVLASKPSYLILDEPTRGLDLKASKELMDLLTKLNNEGMTIVIISHDMDLVNEYAKRVIVLSEGHLVLDSEPKTLFSSHMLNDWSLEEPKLILLCNYLKDQLGHDFGYLTSYDELDKKIKELS